MGVSVRNTRGCVRIPVHPHQVDIFEGSVGPGTITIILRVGGVRALFHTTVHLEGDGGVEEGPERLHGQLELKNRVFSVFVLWQKCCFLDLAKHQWLADTQREEEGVRVIQKSPWTALEVKNVASTKRSITSPLQSHCWSPV